MKRNTLVLLIAIAMISCKKNQQYENKPATFAVDQKQKVIFNTVTEGYSFDYSCLNKKMQLICKRVIDGNVSNIVLSDTSGKTVYASLTMNDITGVITNILTPNDIPFDKILPPGTPGSWKGCMADAIKKCAQLGVLCPCQREMILGCMFGWGIACIGKNQYPITGNYLKIINTNLGSMHP